MNRAQKQASSEELAVSFGKAAGLFATDFRGLTVDKIVQLRFELKKSKTDLKVVKNRLALRAMDGKPYGDFGKHFDYMTAVAITYGDVAAAAKSLTAFSKDNEMLKIRAGYIEGKVINLEQVKALSKLPSKPELLAKLLGTLMAVPTGWVRVLNGVPSKWVYLLEAVRKQKEQDKK